MAVVNCTQCDRWTEPPWDELTSNKATGHEGTQEAEGDGTTGPGIQGDMGARSLAELVRMADKLEIAPTSPPA
jgi:hypothetical protein